MKKIIFMLLSLILIGNGTSNSTEIVTDVELKSGYDSILVTNENLKKGYQYTKEHDELINTNNIDHAKYIYVDNDSYLIIGMERNTLLPYIAYYKEEAMVFEKIFSDYANGYVADAIFNNDCIAIVGNFIKNDISCVFILELSLSGNINKQNKFESDRDSYAYKIFMINVDYFIVGETCSTWIGDAKLDSHKSIFIGRIFINNFNNIFFHMVGNSFSNKYYDAIKNGNEIVVLMKFSGAGYFTDGSKKEFIGVLKMDERLDMPYYISLANYAISEKSKLFLRNDRIGIVMSKRNGDYSILDFDSEFEHPNAYDIFTYTLNNVSDFFVDVFNDKLAILSFDESTNKWEKSVYDNSGACLHYKKLILPQSINNLSFKDNLLTICYYQDEILKLIDEAELKISSNNLYSNGVYIKGEEKTNDDKIKYILYKIRNVSILVKNTNVIPIKVNVENYEIYDLGIKLEFNCQATLNGKVIENGYVIEKADKYYLELKNESGNVETIFFTVNDMSINNMKETYFNKNEIETSKINEKLFSTEEMFECEVNLKEFEGERDYYLLVVFFVLGLVGTRFILRRKKNV